MPLLTKVLLYVSGHALCNDPQWMIPDNTLLEPSHLDHTVRPLAVHAHPAVVFHWLRNDETEYVLMHCPYLDSGRDTA